MTTRALPGSLLLLSLLTLALAGCYNPDLTGPGGFTCASSPQCPSGWSCVNKRCLPPGQQPPDARLEPRPDGPRTEARVDARVDRPPVLPDGPAIPDGPVMPDWPLMPDLPLPTEGPVPPPDLPPPPTFSCAASGNGQSLAPPAFEIGEHFDYEASGAEAAVAFFLRLTSADPLVPYLAHRVPGQWLGAGTVYIDTTATPPVGQILPHHEIAVSLPVSPCMDRRTLVVFRHTKGIWAATDSNGGPALSWNVESHTPSGVGLDLIPAKGWVAKTGMSSCAVFFATYAAVGIGTRRTPIDVGNKMSHWFQAVAPTETTGTAQHWDGTHHTIFLASASSMEHLQGGTDQLDPFAATAMGSTNLPAQSQSVEQAFDRQVYAAMTGTEVVRYVEPQGPGSTTSELGQGWLPSLAVQPATNEEAVVFVTKAGAMLVARKFGGKWSLPLPIANATRAKVRPLGPNTWEIVYRRLTPMPPGSPVQELVAQTFVCK